VNGVGQQQTAVTTAGQQETKQDKNQSGIRLKERKYILEGLKVPSHDLLFILKSLIQEEHRR